MKKLYVSSFKETCADAVRNRMAKWFFRRLWIKGTGPKMWLLPGDAVCREILIRGMFDKTLLRGMEPLLKPLGKGVILDVGANIGNHTLFFAPLFKKVVAFEPNPQIFTILSANVLLNRLENVSLVMKGLGAKKAKLPFYDNMAHNFGAMGFVANSQGKKGAKIADLEVLPADEALKDLGIPLADVTAIKLDVEGFELDVLKGMTKLLAKHPLVMFEVLNKELGEPVVEALKAAGYKHFYHVKEGRCFGREVCSLEEVPALEDRYYALLVAVQKPLEL